jgi:hypothetical protein
MSAEELPAWAEDAIEASVPVLVDLLARSLPSAFSPIADYRPAVVTAAGRWARALVADLLARHVRVDAAPGASVRVRVE